MIKPNMPNIPGIGAMADTLEFVKNLWSGAGLPGMKMVGMGMPGMTVPGMVMPTLSVEEVNKKIADLKAVESWLTLNMNMLRGTIQALEVQAATISTLQSMGQTFGATMGVGPLDRTATSEVPAPPNGSNGASSAPGAANGSGGLEPTSKDEADAATLTAPLVNAAAWWNMLQDQFKQAVNSAMSAETAAVAPTEKKKAQPKAKTVAKTTAAGATRKRKATK